MLRGYRDRMSQKYIVNCVSFVECPLCYRCRRDVGGQFLKCRNCIAFGCHHDERHYQATLKKRPRIEITTDKGERG